MSLFANVDHTIRKNTRYIVLVVLILTVLMEAVFLIIGKWDITVLFGGLLGAVTAVVNFFLMALGVQKSLEKEEKDAKAGMKVSHSLRMVMLVVVCAIAALLPGVFNLAAVVIPLLFPSVGARLYGTIVKES